MSKIGPEFKQNAKKIIDFIANTDPEVIMEELNPFYMIVKKLFVVFQMLQFI